MTSTDIPQAAGLVPRPPVDATPREWLHGVTLPAPHRTGGRLVVRRPSTCPAQHVRDTFDNSRVPHTYSMNVALVAGA